MEVISKFYISSKNKNFFASGGSSNNGAPQQFEYELELLEDVDPGAGDKWQLIAYSTGSFTNDDCLNDIFQIRFDKVVLIKVRF